MQTLSYEIVRGDHARQPRLVEFSPLDLFVMGHHTHGPIFGFEHCIDAARFRRSLQCALDANPEMGAALAIDASGKHWLRTGAGIELIVQRATGPLPPAHRLASLPLQQFPLAHAGVDAEQLIDGQLPLLGFRITRFDDGACTLGIRTTHSHLDGIALIDFLVGLGEIYNDGPAHAAQVGRAALAQLASGDGLAPSPALHVTTTPVTMSPDENKSPNCEFAHTQIAFEQDVFDSYVGRVRAEKSCVKTADIVCALAWKAWLLSGAASAERTLRIYSIFNLRQLREWPLGRHYLGNAVLDRRAELDRHVLENGSVAAIAHAFRRQTKPVSVADVAADIGYLKRLRDERYYARDGSCRGLRRAFIDDMAVKRAISVNDLRFLQLHKVRFEGPALWYESGQDFPGIQGYVEVTQRASGDIVFHYHSQAAEAERFEWELRKLVCSAYVYN